MRPGAAEDEPKRRKVVADGRSGGSRGAGGSGGGGAVSRPAAAAAGASPGASTCHLLRQAPRPHVRQEWDEQLPRPQGRRRPLWAHAARAALAVALHLP